MEPPSCPSLPQEPQNPRNWPQKLPPRERTQLRNRRFAALRQLIKEGDYFSEERMRLRAPGLFHHYIGRFRDPKTSQNHPKTPQNHPKNPQNSQIHPKMSQIHPKMSQNDPKIAQNGPKMAANGPKMAAGLRELLLSALEEGEAEEEEEEDEDDEDEDEEQLPDEAEQELLRLEFISRMHQSFLEGLDGDFDYSQVDENSDLDALDLLGQDLEDSYFDEEEPGPAPPLV